MGKRIQSDALTASNCDVKLVSSADENLHFSVHHDGILLLPSMSAQSNQIDVYPPATKHIENFSRVKPWCVVNTWFQDSHSMERRLRFFN